jgi:hypothetical protein
MISKIFLTERPLVPASRFLSADRAARAAIGLARR